MPKPENYPSFYPFAFAESASVTGRPVVIVDVEHALWYSGNSFSGLGGWTYWYIAGCRGRVFHELRAQENKRLTDYPSRLYFDDPDEARGYAEGIEAVPAYRWVFPRLPVAQDQSMRIAGVFNPRFSNDIGPDSIEAYMWLRNQAKANVYNSEGLLLFTDIDDLAAFKLKFG